MKLWTKTWGLAATLAIFLLNPVSADTVYSIRQGDSLAKIAKSHGVTVDQLLSANPAMKDTSKFQAGVFVVVPDGDEKREEKKGLTPPRATAVRIEGRTDTVAMREQSEEEEEYVLLRSGDYRRRASLNSRHGRILSGVTKAATQYMGTPYVFGGVSRRGIDCSGFTMQVFSMVGIQLPRTADVQFNVGTAVGKGKEQPGDLVFFQTYCAGPSHVGIYLGSGRFIHASSSRGVTISGLKDEYFGPRYLGAKRVF